MNTLELKGNWNVAKGRLKQRWARLTDDDLGFKQGKEVELIGRIQMRRRETRETVQKVVERACNSRSSRTIHKEKGTPRRSETSAR